MKKYLSILIVFIISFKAAIAQPDRWQQRVKYTMNIDMNVVNNQFKGKQKLEYTNNSPDQLKKLFYHLYFNAFQPNSSMDVRSRELGRKLVNGRQDWDNRVRDRILHLKDDEIGFQKIISLKIGGIAQQFKYHETILEVDLVKPILPKTKVVIEMEFEAQVPLQIRRSGRDNPTTGVRYSMSQWYPKLCEYDYEGWHPTPYVAREFYGVWGDYDVTINIDKNYKLGGTGVIQNASEIGWGYDVPGSPLKNIAQSIRSWHFLANNVHDFVWAADTAYQHLVRKSLSGKTILHVIYKYKPNDFSNDSSWNVVGDAAVKVLPFIEKNFGQYPYPQYSFIQGGDGGMEYPMATLLNGPGLNGVFHEWMHSWYQMMLGTNESMYPWMDEGFTSYAENLVSKFYNKYSSLDEYRTLLKENPDSKGLKELMNFAPEDHVDAYAGYFQLVKSGLEEPLTTHADHYNNNFAYSVASYSKGEIFVEQLGYIVGAAMRDKILLEYYRQWRFKHPNAADFIKLAEDQSGIKLDWYKEYWCNTTKTIDYSIDSLWEENGVSKIRLKRIGNMPMPIDLKINFKDGSSEIHCVPLNLMFGSKLPENEAGKDVWKLHEEWRWTHPTYVVEIKQRLTEIKKVEIDPSKRMADIDRKNNVLELNW